MAKAVCDAHLGPGIFNYEGWKYILEEHGGRLPLRIKAVPEGSVVPFRNGMYICTMYVYQEVNEGYSTDEIHTLPVTKVSPSN